MKLQMRYTSEIDCRLGAIRNEDVWHKAPAQSSESVREYTRTLYNELNLKYSKFHKMDDFCRLGFLTAECLMLDINDQVAKDRLGVFLINQQSSLNTDIKFYNSYTSDNQSLPSPSLFVYTLPNILIGEISIRHKITGEHSFFVQPRFGTEFIYLYVQTLFETNIIDAALIGTCEVASDNFSSKMGYLTRTLDDDETCKKMDKLAFDEWINMMP